MLLAVTSARHAKFLIRDILREITMPLNKFHAIE